MYKIVGFDKHETLTEWLNENELNVEPKSVWSTPVAVYLLYYDLNETRPKIKIDPKAGSKHP